MKKFDRAALLSVLVFLVAMSSMVCAETDETKQAAKGFWVEDATIELESVAAGTDAVATFVFHNDTNKTVTILKAKPS